MKVKAKQCKNQTHMGLGPRGPRGLTKSAPTCVMETREPQRDDSAGRKGSLSEVAMVQE